ncbi:MAG: DNA adenine methylase [Bacteroidaceae bacterium]|nr:DNA adenine methylase [Bacteroidaceae bacterium]
MGFNVDKENWKESDINVDSLWIIPERGKNGKHKNVYHGNFIPQIPNQLIRRYTNTGDTVLELFSGSGTTLFECEALQRDYIGFDINTNITEYVKNNMLDCTNIKYAIKNIDVTNVKELSDSIDTWLIENNKKYVDFMIAHPPYLDIVKFTDNERDLSNITNIDCFIKELIKAIGCSMKYLKTGSYFAVVAGDIYKNSEVVPLAFKIMEAIKDNFDVKMKGIIVKNIEGNRGKLKTLDIWKYRALRSDYYLFKHEYIFVFKKQ